MAMVKKLSLQGVRSFSPADNRHQWIEFGSPLTLILGVNGSGKTTIIEALRFAVTSQFPPNSAKGASFVNDPKLSRSDKALAKITLELLDAQGNKYTTSRKIKTVVKNQKGDLSMTQLEGTLRVKTVKGESKEISNKVADIKYEMSRLMGVSEAIFSHVIFCHQEESCWPLDEGKKVKTTFDAIFNTLAYKKCFDRLQFVDKDLTTKIKVQAEGLRFVKENRLAARQKNIDLQDKKIELHQKRDSIQQLDRDIKQMEEKLRELQALEQEYAKKQGEVSEKRATLKGLEDQMKELRSNIKEEFQGTVTDLKEYINNFKQECLEKSNDSRKLERELTKKEVEWKKVDQSRTGLLKEEGMFQQEENANKKNQEQLEARLSEIVTVLKKVKTDARDDILSTSFTNFLEACDSETGGNTSYDSVMKTVVGALKMKDSELEKVKEEFAKEESDLQSAIDEVRAKMASMEKEREMKKQQIANNKTQYDELRTRLKNLEGSTEKLAMMDDEEENLVSQIEQIENSGFMMKCDSEIKSLTGEVKELEEQVSKLSEIVNILFADKSKTDQISFYRTQKLQKQNDCNAKMRLIEDDLRTVLEVEEVPQDGLGAEVDSKLKNLMKELQVKKSDLKTNERALNTAKSELKYVSADLKKNEAKLKANKEKVTDVLADKDYNAAYTDVTDELEEAQQTCYFTESASFVYKKYIQKLNKKDCCPLCKRDQTRDLSLQLVSELEADINRMKENVPALKGQVETLKKRQQQVLKAKPIWDECQRLEMIDIPKLKTRQAELNETEEKLTDENEGIAMIVAEIEGNLQLLQKLKSSVEVIENSRKEIKSFDNSIAKFERQRKPEAKNLTMTLEDAQTEQQQLQTKVNSKRSEKEKKEEIRNRKRDELARLQEDKNKLKEEKLKITAELQNREALEQQKKALEASNRDLQVKVTELIQSLPAVKTEIQKTERSRNVCSQKKEEALKKLREDKTSLEKQKESISELNRRIQEFEKKRGRYAEVQQRVADCNKKLALCDQQKLEISNQIDVLKKDLANQELKKRELEDNLLLKQKMEEVSRLKVELKEKEQILGQAENKGATTLKREIQAKWSKDSAKFNELTGSKTELQKSIKELEKELASPMYKNAEIEYTEKIARKTIYEKAQRDVRRYKTALDQAIMQFHIKKMGKINKILLEYWRRIYKGNDIDRIMIKTENEHDHVVDAKGKGKGKISALGSTRKNYNYRVVMSRRGVEIDMRGRCSAGQRVLASIIIRIALAESFGARCGIITLDEPTTNLDQKNINSLADALADLAEKMSSRRNFQLIVITHDQEFTSRLSSVDAVEKYWKVDRDKDGFSQITMIPKRGYGEYNGASYGLA